MEPSDNRRPGLLRMLFEFVFPRYCKVCGRRLDLSEEHLCITCFIGMPAIDYSMDQINPTERMLLTERSLVRAASVLQYSKDSDYRKIVFHLKYWNHPQVGTWLAQIGAVRLYDKGFFEGIDCIVPLPLTRSKERKRGYNQCMYIAQGIQKVTGLPIISDALTRDKEHTRQAGLGRYQRWRNASELFRVLRSSTLSAKHVLVVDDVITTGATLCSLIDTMQQQIPNLKVSVFTLAMAV